MKSNKLRSFLTILGILIGICAVVLMVAVGQTVRNEINKELESLGGNRLIVLAGSGKRGGVAERGSRLPMKYQDYLAIRGIKNVKYSSPIVYLGGARVIYGANNWATTVIGTTPEYFMIQNYELESGTIFSEQDVTDGIPYVVIGQAVVEALFDEGENPIGATLRIRGRPFTVIGTLAEKGGGQNNPDDVIIAPLFSVKRRLTNNRVPNSIGGIDVITDDEETLSRVSDRITALLQERHKIASNEYDDFEIRNMKEIANKVSQVGFILSVLLISIASISLLVGSIGIMNMMLVSVTERTREIGIRKALGAKSKDIMIQFLLESVLLSMVGSFVGMIFGIVLSQIGGMIFKRSVPISASTIIVSMVIAIAVGIVSGMVPAMKATKLDPTEALRYQ
ncbi:MAG: ABC transporter permease [Rickettsiales bacterium]|nr:ABC transporter permease [Rickettsiales bacterium]